MHMAFEGEQTVFASVHLFPAQHMPKLLPQVMQLPVWQTVSTVIGPGASHWPPSAMHDPPSMPSA
jgi:hypothetical protein